jgi:hypothetical protein
MWSGPSPGIATGIGQANGLPAPPNTKNTRELKRRVNAAPLWYFITEIGDAVDCFWNQLPADLQVARKIAWGHERTQKEKDRRAEDRRAGRKPVPEPKKGPGGKTGIPLDVKIADLVDNWDRFLEPAPVKNGQIGKSPLDKAMECVAQNEATDRAIGRLGQNAKNVNAALEKRYGRAFNTGRGPAL